MCISLVLWHAIRNSTSLKILRKTWPLSAFSLQWRHNERNGVSNYSVSIVCSTVGSGADHTKHQSYASLAFVWGIHRWQVTSPHKMPVTRKMFPFDDVIMCDDYLFLLPPCDIFTSLNAYTILWWIIQQSLMMGNMATSDWWTMPGGPLKSWYHHHYAS